MKVMCISDGIGYWTEGEVYVAEADGSFIRVGDDDSQDTSNGWILDAYEVNDQGSAVSYVVTGYGDATVFEEVAENE